MTEVANTSFVIHFYPGDKEFPIPDPYWNLSYTVVVGKSELSKPDTAEKSDFTWKISITPSDNVNFAVTLIEACALSPTSRIFAHNQQVLSEGFIGEQTKVMNGFCCRRNDYIELQIVVDGHQELSSRIVVLTEEAQILF